MKVNRLSPDIYEIEDFVTVEQQKQVLDFCNSLEEEQWWIAISENFKEEFFYGKQYHGQLPEVFDEINENLRKIFTQSEYVPDIALQRSLDHEPMQAHRDYWLRNEDYHVRYGVVIYYNDDYEGGEIEYAELGIVHKPKARSLVLHGGNILHGPRKVTDSKVRYFSTAFVRATATNPVILNKELFGEVELHDGSSYP
jgi:hypothetical protein